MTPPKRRHDLEQDLLNVKAHLENQSAKIMRLEHECAILKEHVPEAKAATNESLGAVQLPPLKLSIEAGDDSNIDLGLEACLDILDAKKPGAKDRWHYHQELVDQNKRDGSWAFDQCYVPHHEKPGDHRVGYGHMKTHHSQGTCGNCMDRGRSNCTAVQGDDPCRQCELHSIECWTYDQYYDAYEVLKNHCKLHNTPDLWSSLRVFLSGEMLAYKLKYLRDQVTQYIKNRSNEVELEGYPTACYIHQKSAIQSRLPPRGNVYIWCTELVVHVENIGNVPYLRLLHLIDAVERADALKIEEICSGAGEIVHLHPADLVNDTYCWKWEHTVWASKTDNCRRDTQCFTGKKLCQCEIPCFYNGHGNRFTRNVIGEPEHNARYGHWRPADGTGGKTYYHSPEPVLFTAAQKKAEEQRLDREEAVKMKHVGKVPKGIKVTKQGVRHTAYGRVYEGIIDQDADDENKENSGSTYVKNGVIHDGDTDEE